MGPCSQAEFHACGERNIVLRVEAIGADRDVVEYFQPPGNPIPVLKLNTTTYWECDQCRISTHGRVVYKFVTCKTSS